MYLCGRRDRMVAGLWTTYAISVYHHWCCEFESRPGELYSIQHYVIKFVSDLRQVGCFLRCPSPIKLTAAKSLKYCWKWRKYHNVSVVIDNILLFLCGFEPTSLVHCSTYWLIIMTNYLVFRLNPFYGHVV